jgi:hypothetical protein
MKSKLLLLLFLLFVKLANAQQGFPFADEIRVFKHQDSISFPQKNGILFIGSSSIRLWDDLEKRFADKPIIKRGVGGCQLSQLVDFYTPYILFPYQPRKIFIYAGENDIAAGENADFVLDKFKLLWESITKKLPKASIYYMSIKPSPSRVKFLPEVIKANKYIKDYLAGKPKSTFIELGSVLYKKGTTVPDSSLYRSDYLHLNHTGYDRWQKVLTPYVK